MGMNPEGAVAMGVAGKDWAGRDNQEGHGNLVGLPLVVVEEHPGVHKNHSADG